MNEVVDDNQRALRDLIAVLQLGKLARAASKHDELAFLIVNDTHRTAKYEQAFLCSFNANDQLRVEAVSGVAQPDNASPYLQHLQRVLRGVFATENASQLHAINPESLSEKLQADWQAINIQNPLWCPFVDNAGILQAVLVLTRRDPWTQADTTRLDFLIDAYAQSWLALTRQRITWRARVSAFKERARQRKYQLLSIIAIVLVMLIPVSQTVTAPAEVVAEQPTIISPPVDGVVKRFYVKPNEAVKSGQVLFELEDSVIRNRYEVGLKALSVAQADYRRAIAKAFSDERSKAEVNLLKAVAEQKAEEVKYARDLLNRIKVKASRDGLAVYSNENDWLGKPVRVGERIITLADPDKTELLVWLPVDDAISFPQQAEVSAFLNVDPTSPLEAGLRQFSYEAQPSPEDVLSFQLRARFVENVQRPRIGLKATAKVYGEKVSLFYYIFRRPLAAARRYIGW